MALQTSRPVTLAASLRVPTTTVTNVVSQLEVIAGEAPLPFMSHHLRLPESKYRMDVRRELSSNDGRQLRGMSKLKFQRFSAPR